MVKWYMVWATNYMGKQFIRIFEDEIKALKWAKQNILEIQHVKELKEDTREI